MESKTAFFQLGNEILDVFQPIMGATCYTVYSHLKRRAYKEPELKHSIQSLAELTGLAASTISRSLEILSYLGLIKLHRRGGSQKSRCTLLDSKTAAEHLGARYNRLDWSLPEAERQRLSAEVEAIRQRQQGKCAASTPNTCGNRSVTDSQRKARVSLENGQRTRREMQTGSHLIQEERRIEESPSPTPSQECGEPESAKDLPNKDGLDADLLLWAQRQFTGAIDELREGLLDINRPPTSHLANGAAEWSEMGVNSWGVTAAAQRGDALVLTLTANDPAAAARGLAKYRMRWEKACRKWFACEVVVEWIKLERGWEIPAAPHCAPAC